MGLPIALFVFSVATKCFGKSKRRSHAEALEACALGLVNYALTVVYVVKAFTLMLRVPQHDPLLRCCQ
jgi:hypothetical protein